MESYGLGLDVPVELVLLNFRLYEALLKEWVAIKAALQLTFK